ncbi:MAG: ester cyclase [Devosia sp.]
MSEAAEAERNIAVMRQAFAALGRGDVDACTALMTDDFIINIAEMPQQKRGIAAWRAHAKLLLAAFPDIKVEIEDVFAVGDKLAVRVRLTGTHRGEFLGNAPTGKRIDYRSHEIYRFEHGKLAEEWICSDMLTLMTQVGAFSEGRLLGMWLAGYRLWLGLAAGVMLGAGAVLAVLALG